MGHIRTELPGPRARALLARDAAVTTPSYPRDCPFVMSHGRGTEVWDVDGNRFLDFEAGIAVCATGHAHPQVVAAIKAAADDFVHISSDFWHERMTALAERLVRLAPLGEPALAFLCQSGTESVEAAIKLARYVTRRPRYIGFLGAFHVRTMGSLAFTSSKYTPARLCATMPGVTHVPYPNPIARCSPAPTSRPCSTTCASSSSAACRPPRLRPSSSSRSRAGGYLVPPEGFLAGLRALADEHGILLVFDEVQCGWAHGPDVRLRTLGRASRHRDAREGLGSGVPIGAVIAKRRLVDSGNAAHGNTFGGNPSRAPRRCHPRSRRARVRGARRKEWRVLQGTAADARPTLSLHRRSARQGVDDRHGADRAGAGARTRKGPVRCARDARVPQRPAAPLVRHEHCTLHAAAQCQCGRDRRGARVAGTQPRRSATGSHA